MGRGWGLSYAFFSFLFFIQIRGKKEEKKYRALIHTPSPPPANMTTTTNRTQCASTMSNTLHTAGPSQNAASNITTSATSAPTMFNNIAYKATVPTASPCRYSYLADLRIKTGAEYRQCLRYDPSLPDTVDAVKIQLAQAGLTGALHHGVTEFVPLGPVPHSVYRRLGRDLIQLKAELLVTAGWPTPQDAEAELKKLLKLLKHPKSPIPANNVLGFTVNVQGIPSVHGEFAELAVCRMSCLRANFDQLLLTLNDSPYEFPAGRRSHKFEDIFKTGYHAKAS